MINAGFLSLALGLSSIMFMGHKYRKFSKIRMNSEVKASGMFLLFIHLMISVVCALELKYC